MMDINLISARAILFSAVIGLFTHSASAKWTVTTEGAPSGCNHVISDGNWKIGVYRNSESNWTLGKSIGQNGSGYVAGSGVLDLRNIAEETKCEAYPSGVILKGANNGSMENAKDKMTECYLPDSFERMAGIFIKNDKTLTKIVFGTGIKEIGSQAFLSCSGLKTVEFPDGRPRLTYLGQQAFRGCSLLESVLDFSLSTFTTVYDYALVDLEKVTEIRLPETLTTISGEAMGYNKRARVVWFCGPPPISINHSNALNSKGGSWVLVAGRKHAAEWKANEHVETITDAEKATAKTAAESFGLKGFKPIGKWTYQTGGYTHWVVEEPISGFITVVR